MKTKFWSPNTLSVIRITLVAPLMITIFIDTLPARIIAMICFAIGSMTDFIDGRWARKSGQVTELGKFLDPLADKMLVNLTFLALVSLGQVPVWIFGVILMRDFIVDGLRMLAASQKVTIAASPFGKLKTLVQMCTILLIMINLIISNDALELVNNILLYIVVALTICSGVDYLARGRKLVL